MQIDLGKIDALYNKLGASRDKIYENIYKEYFPEIYNAIPSAKKMINILAEKHANKPEYKNNKYAINTTGNILHTYKNHDGVWLTSEYTPFMFYKSYSENYFN